MSEHAEAIKLSLRSSPRLWERVMPSNLSSRPPERHDRERTVADRRPRLHTSAKQLWVLVTILSISGLIVAAYSFSHRSPVIKWAPVPRERISGRLEAREIHLGARLPAYVKSVAVAEGDRVKKGQILVLLDDREVKSKLRQADVSIAAAAKMQNLAAMKVHAVNNYAAEAKKKSRGPIAKVMGIFKSKKAKRQKEQQLRAKGAEAAMALQAARLNVARAVAARQTASSYSPYYRIVSPVDGICATRSVEPGEMVNPGQILMTVYKPESVYFKGFIPEGDVAKIKIGQLARVLPDSTSGTKPLRGKVVSIDMKSAFTPENVYFKEDRVKQVFGIRIDLDKPDTSAKPGLPAEAEIILKE